MGVVTTNDMIKILLDRGYNTSPTRTAISHFSIGTEQSELQVTDTDLDTPETFDATDGRYKTFETAAQLDTSLLRMTVRCVVDDVEANGADLDSAAIFNQDSTRLMGVAGTHTLIQKNSSKRVVYVFKTDGRQNIEVN